MMDEFTIDRMILNISGLGPGNAEELSREIAERLASISAAPGDFNQITLSLDPSTNKHDMPRLAEIIVNFLLRQIG